MDGIEYLEEYEELVSGENPETKQNKSNTAMSSRRDPGGSSSEDSSIDHDLFESLFESNSDEEVDLPRKVGGSRQSVGKFYENSSQLDSNRPKKQTNYPKNSFSSQKPLPSGAAKQSFGQFNQGRSVATVRPVQTSRHHSSDEEQFSTFNLPSTSSTSRSSTSHHSTSRPSDSTERKQITAAHSTSAAQRPSQKYSKQIKPKVPPTTIVRSNTIQPKLSRDEDPLKVDPNLSDISDDEDCDASLGLSDLGSDSFEAMSDLDEDVDLDILQITAGSRYRKSNKAKKPAAPKPIVEPQPATYNGEQGSTSKGGAAVFSTENFPEKATIISDTLITRIDTAAILGNIHGIDSKFSTFLTDSSSDQPKIEAANAMVAFTEPTTAEISTTNVPADGSDIFNSLLETEEVDNQFLTTEEEELRMLVENVVGEEVIETQSDGIDIAKILHEATQSAEVIPQEDESAERPQIRNDTVISQLKDKTSSEVPKNELEGENAPVASHERKTERIEEEKDADAEKRDMMDGFAKAARIRQQKIKEFAAKMQRTHEKDKTRQENPKENMENTRENIEGMHAEKENVEANTSGASEEAPNRESLGGQEVTLEKLSPEKENSDGENKTKSNVKDLPRDDQLTSKEQPYTTCQDSSPTQRSQKVSIGVSEKKDEDLAIKESPQKEKSVAKETPQKEQSEAKESPQKARNTSSVSSKGPVPKLQRSTTESAHKSRSVSKESTRDRSISSSKESLTERQTPKKDSSREAQNMSEGSTVVCSSSKETPTEQKTPTKESRDSSRGTTRDRTSEKGLPSEQQMRANESPRKPLSASKDEISSKESPREQKTPAKEPQLKVPSTPKVSNLERSSSKESRIEKKTPTKESSRPAGGVKSSSKESPAEPQTPTKRTKESTNNRSLSKESQGERETPTKESPKAEESSSKVSKTSNLERSSSKDLRIGRQTPAKESSRDLSSSKESLTEPPTPTKQPKESTPNRSSSKQRPQGTKERSKGPTRDRPSEKETPAKESAFKDLTGDEISSKDSHAQQQTPAKKLSPKVPSASKASNLDRSSSEKSRVERQTPTKESKAESSSSRESPAEPLTPTKRSLQEAANASRKSMQNRSSSKELPKIPTKESAQDVPTTAEKSTLDHSSPKESLQEARNGSKESKRNRSLSRESEQQRLINDSLESTQNASKESIMDRNESADFKVPKDPQKGERLLPREGRSPARGPHKTKRPPSKESPREKPSQAEIAQSELKSRMESQNEELRSTSVVESIHEKEVGAEQQAEEAQKATDKKETQSEAQALKETTGEESLCKISAPEDQSPRKAQIMSKESTQDQKATDEQPKTARAASSKEMPQAAKLANQKRGVSSKESPSGSRTPSNESRRKTSTERAAEKGLPSDINTGKIEVRKLIANQTVGDQPRPRGRPPALHKKSPDNGKSVVALGNKSPEKGKSLVTLPKKSTEDEQLLATPRRGRGRPPKNKPADNEETPGASPKKPTTPPKRVTFQEEVTSQKKEDPIEQLIEKPAVRVSTPTPKVRVKRILLDEPKTISREESSLEATSVTTQDEPAKTEVKPPPEKLPKKAASPHSSKPPALKTSTEMKAAEDAARMQPPAPRNSKVRLSSRDRTDENPNKTPRQCPDQDRNIQDISKDPTASDSSASPNKEKVASKEDISTNLNIAATVAASPKTQSKDGERETMECENSKDRNKQDVKPPTDKLPQKTVSPHSSKPPALKTSKEVNEAEDAARMQPPGRRNSRVRLSSKDRMDENPNKTPRQSPDQDHNKQDISKDPTASGSTSSPTKDQVASMQEISANLEVAATVAADPKTQSHESNANSTEKSQKDMPPQKQAIETTEKEQEGNKAEKEKCLQTKMRKKRRFKLTSRKGETRRNDSIKVEENASSKNRKVAVGITKRVVGRPIGFKLQRARLLLNQKANELKISSEQSKTRKEPAVARKEIRKEPGVGENSTKGEEGKGKHVEKVTETAKDATTQKDNTKSSVEPTPPAQKLTRATAKEDQSAILEMPSTSKDAIKSHSDRTLSQIMLKLDQQKRVEISNESKKASEVTEKELPPRADASKVAQERANETGTSLQQPLMPKELLDTIKATLLKPIPATERLGSTENEAGNIAADPAPAVEPFKNPGSAPSKPDTDASKPSLRLRKSISPMPPVTTPSPLTSTVMEMERRRSNSAVRLSQDHEKQTPKESESEAEDSVSSNSPRKLRKRCTESPLPPLNDALAAKKVASPQTASKHTSSTVAPKDIVRNKSSANATAAASSTSRAASSAAASATSPAISRAASLTARTTTPSAISRGSSSATATDTSSPQTLGKKRNFRAPPNPLKEGDGVSTPNKRAKPEPKGQADLQATSGKLPNAKPATTTASNAKSQLEAKDAALKSDASNTKPQAVEQPAPKSSQKPLPKQAAVRTQPSAPPAEPNKNAKQVPNTGAANKHPIKQTVLPIKEKRRLTDNATDEPPTKVRRTETPAKDPLEVTAKTPSTAASEPTGTQQAVKASKGNASVSGEASEAPKSLPPSLDQWIENSKKDLHSNHLNKATNPQAKNPTDKQSTSAAPSNAASKVTAQPASKAASKVAAQTASNAGSKPASSAASKLAAQPASSAASKVAAQPASSAASNTASKPANSAASKVATQPESSVASKVAAQPANSAASKVATQQASSFASKVAAQPESSVASNTASKPASNTASKPANSTASKVATQPASSAASKVAAQPASSAASKVATQPASSSASKVAAEPDSSAASNTASKPASNTANKPASNTANKPANSAASKVATQPASSAASKVAAQPASSAASKVAAQPASSAASSIASKPVSSKPESNTVSNAESFSRPPSRPKVKKNETDLLIESMPKEMRDQGIELLLQNSQRMMTKRSLASTPTPSEIAAKTVATGKRPSTSPTTRASTPSTAPRPQAERVVFRTPRSTAYLGSTSWRRDMREIEQTKTKKTEGVHKTRKCRIRINRSVVRNYWKKQQSIAGQSKSAPAEQEATMGNMRRSRGQNSRAKVTTQPSTAASPAANVANTGVGQSDAGATVKRAPVVHAVFERANTRGSSSVTKSQDAASTAGQPRAHLPTTTAAKTAATVGANAAAKGGAASASTAAGSELQVVPSSSGRAGVMTIAPQNRRAAITQPQSSFDTCGPTAENTLLTPMRSVPVTEPLPVVRSAQHFGLSNSAVDHTVAGLPAFVTPKRELVEEGQASTPPTVSSLSAVSLQRLLSNAPQLTQQQINNNSYGVTPPTLANGMKIYTFLYPSRYSKDHYNVYLDLCSPNLDGPMPAIDPTRLHSQTQALVREIPALVVMTTKLMTHAELEKGDGGLPPSMRAKVNRMKAHRVVPEAATPTTPKTSDATASTSMALTRASVTPAPVVQPRQPAAPAQPLTPTLPQLPTRPALAAPLIPTPEPSLAASVLNYQKQLPATTTITAKVLTLPAVGTTEAIPTQRNANVMRTSILRFDSLLKIYNLHISTMPFAERERMLERVIEKTKLSQRDLDNANTLLEEYAMQLSAQRASSIGLTTAAPPQTSVTAALNRSNNSAAIQSATPQLAASPQLAVTQHMNAVPINHAQPTPAVSRNLARPIYDKTSNIIGYRKSTPKAVRPTATTVTPKPTSVAPVSGASAARPLQESPRIFYTTPLHASTPTTSASTPVTTSNPNAKLPTGPTLRQGTSRYGGDVVIRKVPTTSIATASTSSTSIRRHATTSARISTAPMAGNARTASITATPVAQNHTVTATLSQKRTTRTAAAHVIVVQKGDKVVESILPDAAEAAEIKQEENDDFIGGN